MCCYKYFSHCLYSNVRELEIYTIHWALKYIWSRSHISYSLGIRLALSIFKTGTPNIPCMSWYSNQPLSSFVARERVFMVGATVALPQ